jgi:hypothetical protein
MGQSRTLHIDGSSEELYLDGLTYDGVIGLADQSGR